MLKDNKQPRREEPFLTLKEFIAILVYLIVLSYAVYYVINRLPNGRKLEDEPSESNRFIGESAWLYLRNLTSIGPRVAGSYENEVLAVDFLLNELSRIRRSSSNSFRIETDTQIASGAFPLQFLDGQTNVYNDVQNILIRMISKEYETLSEDSLLLNCHFDSVADSPGASDDGAGCAVMLEIFRVISQSNLILKNHIIFMFNGAEENFMQASHGFVTQHWWAKTVKAFLNFEACGAGGRELLFQAGPRNSWMMKIYADSVPYPFASSMAEEIFQSGVVPGDTDFRIFRDFGQLSGFDFAWASNGYVYHTLFDTIEQMPLNSLQRTGDNMLPLVLNIVNSEELSDVKLQDKKLVFFDVLGLFMVCVPQFVFYAISIIVLTLSYYSHQCLKTDFKTNLTKKKSLMAVMITWILTLAVVLLIALLLTVIDRTMSWYRQPLWTIFLYIIPTLLISITTMSFINKFYYEKELPKMVLFLSYYECNLRIWEIIALVCLIIGIRSVFLPIIWLLFLIFINFGTKFISICNVKKWMCFYFLMLSIPIAQSIYLIISALQLFIPLMGRSGASHNPEIVIGLIVSIMFCALFTFISPLVVFMKKPSRIIYLLSAVFLISLFVLRFTDYGFPYSGQSDHPTPQRFILIHCNRIVHRNNKVVLNKTGYWIVDMDFNSPKYVQSYLPKISQAELLDYDCEQYLYCALPYIVSVQSIFHKTHWISAETDILQFQKPDLQILTKTCADNYCEISIRINGPDHFQVMLSPFESAILTNWSLVDSKPLVGPKWNDRDTYFIYYSYTKNPIPFDFTLTFKLFDNHKITEGIAEIAVCGQILHGEHKTSKTFEKFLDEFPSWTAINAWTASYESWTI